MYTCVHGAQPRVPSRRAEISTMLVVLTSRSNSNNNVDSNANSITVIVVVIVTIILYNGNDSLNSSSMLVALIG